MKGRLYTMMIREQAIFFEVLDDLDLDGLLEPLIFAYHDFIYGFDSSTATDSELHRRAKECLLRYEELLYDDKGFYEMRWNILKHLDLNNAKWEYRDKKS